MLDLFESIAFGLREILEWKRVRLAFVAGLIVTLFWIIVGFFFWNPIVSISGYLLELVPFSMVRSNGAQILSVFVWMQVVLITFALVVVFFGTIFSRKISKEKYSYFYILIIASSVVFWAIVWLFKGDYLHAQFLKLINWLPFETLDKGMAYLMACLMIYNLIVISMFFITTVLSQKVLKSINKEHFDDEVMYDKEFGIIRYSIRDTFIFVVASIVLFPLFFIPFLNWVVQLGLWVYLVKNTFGYDVGTSLFENFDTDKLKKENGAIWTISFASALFNFIPIINFFGPFFGEIAIFHYLKNSKE
ncbi:MAG: EI24 domain-containing protein [Sulfurospirillum sp.]